MSAGWQNLMGLLSKTYVCGYCSNPIASNLGFPFFDSSNRTIASLYICHHCSKPTYFNPQGDQIPGAIEGARVKYINDPEVEDLFDEARSCFSIAAYTSCVIDCRKLLMHIAVAQNAPTKNYTFAKYVNYLETNGFIPPNGKLWVDAIRKLGNIANHEIHFSTKEEAKLILSFTEMLLRFIYEMPGMMKAQMPDDTRDTEVG